MKLLITILCVIVAIILIFVLVHYIIRLIARRQIIKEGVVDPNVIDEFCSNRTQKYDFVSTHIGYYSILVIACLSTLFPFIWMILTSLKTVAEASDVVNLHFFPAVPQWSNYKAVFERLNILTGLKNTMIIEIGTLPISLFVSALVAYAFEKMKLRHKTFWLLFIMSGMMVPYASVLLPQYRMWNYIFNDEPGLWPFILPTWFGNVSVVFFFIQYMKGIPSELFEASKIDGAGYFKSFLLIMLPNMVLAIVCQAVFGFVSHWNDFFGPSIYLSDPQYKTLQVLLYSFASSGTDKPMLYAASFITCIPLFVIYLAFQKFFVGSLAISGIKE
ncbi:MAG: carbohydrate ABC transporter permease [Bacilli bacterium]